MTGKMQRDAVKVFMDAGFDVEVRAGRKHTQLFFKGHLVHTLSQGTKQTRRADANLRRTVRRLQEGLNPIQSGKLLIRYCTYSLLVYSAREERTGWSAK